MASSGMAEKCSPRMMSRHPVVVTKMFPREAAFSIVVTSNPAMAAWRALIGSISVMMTREPYERSDSAHCEHELVSEPPLPVQNERETYALSNVSVAGDDGDLSSEHDVGRTLDAVDERLAAAVEVVELALGDGVVDVDSGDLEAAGLHELVEVVDTGGGLLGDSRDAGEELGVAVVDERGEVSAVVEDDVERLAVREALDGLVHAPDGLLLSLALPGEDGDAGRGDGSGGLVCGAERR